MCSMHDESFRGKKAGSNAVSPPLSERISDLRCLGIMNLLTYVPICKPDFGVSMCACMVMCTRLVCRTKLELCLHEPFLIVVSCLEKIRWPSGRSNVADHISSF